MKKIHLFGLAMFAVFAFSALAAMAASAAEVPSWLVNGEPVLLGTRVDVDILPDPEIGGTLLLEDMSASGSPDILCEVTKALGWLLPNGEDEQVEGECLLAVDDKATCLTNADLKVEPVNLPWLTLVEETVGGEFIDNLVSGTGGNPGWRVKCLVLGIEITDTCTSTTGRTFLKNEADGLILAEFDEARKALCTLPNNEEGLVAGGVFLHALTEAEVLVSLAVSLAPEEV